MCLECDRKMREIKRLRKVCDKISDICDLCPSEDAESCCGCLGSSMAVTARLGKYPERESKGEINEKI